MKRREALTELAKLDEEELAGDFYEFASKRANILHASSAWGFCSDGAIITRLLDEVERLKAPKRPPEAHTAPPPAKPHTD